MHEEYVTFGLSLDDLEKASRRIEKLFGIKMQGRESYNLGGDLYSFEFAEGTEIDLIQNWNAVEGEWNEPDHPEFPLIINLSRAVDAAPFERKLVADKVLQAVVLEKSEYDD